MNLNSDKEIKNPNASIKIEDGSWAIDSKQSVEAIAYHVEWTVKPYKPNNIQSAIVIYKFVNQEVETPLFTLLLEK